MALINLWHNMSAVNYLSLRIIKQNTFRTKVLGFDREINIIDYYRNTFRWIEKLPNSHIIITLRYAIFLRNVV